MVLTWDADVRVSACQDGNGRGSSSCLRATKAPDVMGAQRTRRSRSEHVRVRPAERRRPVGSRSRPRGWRGAMAGARALLRRLWCAAALVLALYTPTSPLLPPARAPSVALQRGAGQHAHAGAHRQGALILAAARASPPSSAYSVPLRDRTQDLPGWQGEAANASILPLPMLPLTTASVWALVERRGSASPTVQPRREHHGGSGHRLELRPDEASARSCQRQQQGWGQECQLQLQQRRRQGRRDRADGGGWHGPGCESAGRCALAVRAEGPAVGARRVARRAVAIDHRRARRGS
eukprot:scaffold719_cov359-Prasinococcus_capsulatus_cf.AAC.12